jgi:hypothetical protein
VVQLSPGICPIARGFAFPGRARLRPSRRSSSEPTKREGHRRRFLAAQRRQKVAWHVSAKNQSMRTQSPRRGRQKRHHDQWKTPCSVPFPPDISSHHVYRSRAITSGTSHSQSHHASFRLQHSQSGTTPRLRSTRTRRHPNRPCLARLHLRHAPTESAQSLVRWRRTDHGPPTPPVVDRPHHPRKRQLQIPLGLHLSPRPATPELATPHPPSPSSTGKVPSPS